MAAAGALLLGTVAAAAGPQAEANPCADDIAKSCKFVVPGGGRVLMCLMDHVERLKPELPEACQKWLIGKIGAANDAIDLCTDDIMRFCKKVPPGDGKVLACLKKNGQSIDRKCLDAITVLWYD